MVPDTSVATPVRWLAFSIKGLLAFFFALSLALAATCYWLGYMPGTLETRVDGLRVEAWGTGVREIHYRSGAIQSRHWFRAGRRLKSEWYRPDGTVLATTMSDDGMPAKFYQLRDDGTVSDEFFLLDGVPDGKWFHYDDAGKLVRIDELLGGFVINSEEVN